MIRPQTCPICRQELDSTAPADSKWFPFCSERCRNVDLLRWSKGSYAIVEPLTPEQILEEMREYPGGYDEGYPEIPDA
ncbi:DNA gyrase inhibitor YacG [Calycomorphotria hydatis]|uniref:DNA gyrase inhibitor YacG n=1 Tax=Calycomorphotria hydatis TaxID=2528027 RepID=A0A517T7W5_9PLAN|nr:DNA gyrase inhibitor YacG [Calycomorphotria hydatis]QDT64466.1 zinc-binding protein [Calycomorphotria hydatis]